MEDFKEKLPIIIAVIIMIILMIGAYYFLVVHKDQYYTQILNTRRSRYNIWGRVEFLEDIPWENNLIKEEGIYIPIKNLVVTFILIIIFILNTIKIRKNFKKDNQNTNISISNFYWLIIYFFWYCISYI